MKILTKSAISAAIVAAMAATSAQADPFQKFIDDSSVDLNLRNYYKTKHITDRGTPVNNDKDKGWAQAVNLSLTSGFLYDVIGFDISTHYVFKLKDSIGSNNVSNSGLFLTNGAKNGKTHGHSYGKTLGAVKINLVNGVAKYGRMVMDTPLLNDNADDGSLPSSTEGFYADYSMYGVTVFGAMAKKGNAEAESGYEDYEVDGKKKAVNTIGASFEWEGLNLSGAYAKQSDAVKATYLDASYGLDLDNDIALNIGAQYGENKAIGFVKARDMSTGEDSKIKWHGLMAEASYQNLTAMVAMTDIGGGQNTGWSDASVGWEMGEDATEFLGYNSVLISDFNEANETAYQLRVDYDFADLAPGLSAYGLYVKGSIDDSNGVTKADTSEFNVGINYAVPMLEGLNLSLAHGKHEKNPAGASNTVTEKETRIIVTYDLAIF